MYQGKPLQLCRNVRNAGQVSIVLAVTALATTGTALQHLLKRIREQTRQRSSARSDVQFRLARSIVEKRVG